MKNCDGKRSGNLLRHQKLYVHMCAQYNTSSGFSGMFDNCLHSLFLCGFCVVPNIWLQKLGLSLLPQVTHFRRWCLESIIGNGFLFGVLGLHDCWPFVLFVLYVLLSVRVACVGRLIKLLLKNIFSFTVRFCYFILMIWNGTFDGRTNFWYVGFSVVLDISILAANSKLSTKPILLGMIIIVALLRLP